MRLIRIKHLRPGDILEVFYNPVFKIVTPCIKIGPQWAIERAKTYLTVCSKPKRFGSWEYYFDVLEQGLVRGDSFVYVDVINRHKMTKKTLGQHHLTTNRS